MKLSIAVTALLIALTGPPTVANSSTPWEEYLENPTPQNASKVAKISYSPGVDAAKQVF